jgi:hypothetical protein
MHASQYVRDSKHYFGPAVYFRRCVTMCVRGSACGHDSQTHEARTAAVVPLFVGGQHHALCGVL